MSQPNAALEAAKGINVDLRGRLIEQLKHIEGAELPFADVTLGRDELRRFIDSLTPANAPSPSPELAPGHTDLMISPEAIIESLALAQAKEALREFLGDETLESILWKNANDDELVTIRIKMGKYRRAREAYIALGGK